MGTIGEQRGTSDEQGLVEKEAAIRPDPARRSVRAALEQAMVPKSLTSLMRRLCCPLAFVLFSDYMIVLTIAANSNNAFDH